MRWHCMLLVFSCCFQILSFSLTLWGSCGISTPSHICDQRTHEAVSTCLLVHPPAFACDTTEVTLIAKFTVCLVFQLRTPWSVFTKFAQPLGRLHVLTTWTCVPLKPCFCYPSQSPTESWSSSFLGLSSSWLLSYNLIESSSLFSSFFSFPYFFSTCLWQMNLMPSTHLYPGCWVPWKKWHPGTAWCSQWLTVWDRSAP